MDTEYIDAIEALKLWVGDEFSNDDIEFYEFMKKNNCPEIFVEYTKNKGGGLMGDVANVDLINNKVKTKYLNKIINIYKKTNVIRKVKGIIILGGKKHNEFGICDKEFPDLIIPTIDEDKVITIYTY